MLVFFRLRVQYFLCHHISIVLHFSSRASHFENVKAQRFDIELHIQGVLNFSPRRKRVSPVVRTHEIETSREELCPGVWH